MKQSITRHLLAGLIVVAIGLGGLGVVQAALQLQSQESPFPDCRFGLGVSSPIADYAAHQLGLGWYLDWGTRTVPVRPNGMQYLQTVALRQNHIVTQDGQYVYLPGHVFTPTLDGGPYGLGTRVQANPGAIWIIGNEPDRVGPGGLMPDEFAEANL